jgi:hypothetical protein
MNSAIRSVPANGGVGDFHPSALSPHLFQILIVTICRLMLSARPAASPSVIRPLHSSQTSLAESVYGEPNSLYAREARSLTSLPLAPARASVGGGYAPVRSEYSPH